MHMTDSDKNFYQMAIECAAMPVHMGLKTIDGTAVIAILAYARTLSGVTEEERGAIVGKAFDIFAAAVRADA